MPRAERGTPKDLANRMKSKGLQKLRWYCQMCQKQCRDENGFKCHCTSEGHIRQMQLFAQNPHKFVDQYSIQFERAFMSMMKRRFFSKPVSANVAYNEYISDKQHLHMNSTQWESLNAFVQHLGRTGQCVVEKTDRGWNLTYVDRSPEALARQAKQDKKQKQDLDDEQRHAEMIKRQIQAAAEHAEALGLRTTDDDPETFEKFERQNEDEKIAFSLTPHVPESKLKPSIFEQVAPSSSSSSSSFSVSSQPSPSPLATRSVFDMAAASNESLPTVTAASVGDKRKLSSMDAIMAEEERKAKQQRTEHWLADGIVVKCKNQKIKDGAYYNAKGVVIKLVDKFVGDVEMIPSGDVLRLDQAHLETVVPAIGGHVKIVNGGFRGEIGTLEAVDFDNFNASIRIDKGARKGRLLEKIDYEDFSKLA